MIVHEVPLTAVACDAKQARHRPPAWCQDRADEENLGVLPGAVDEKRRKRQHDPGEAGGQRRHGASLGGDATNLTVTSASSPEPTHQPAKLAKVELSVRPEKG